MDIEEEIIRMVEMKMRNDGIQRLSLPTLLGALEHKIIETLAFECFNKNHLAECLGIQRTTLLWKLDKLGITVLDKHRRRPATYQTHGLPRSKK